MVSKKTKIIATLGPSSRDLQTITELLQNGADVFRLNFSHGTHEDHAQSIALVKEAAAALGINPAILADLQGPKIRTGRTPQDQAITITRDSTVYITSQISECTAENIYVDLPDLDRDLKVGDSIILNDGVLSLVVVAIEADLFRVKCRALNTGTYSSRKGVNFPNAHLSVPSITQKDRDDIEFIRTQPVDFVALSFVRRAEDIVELKKILGADLNHLRIIAKIEKPEAAADIDRIIDTCDGIMVARGDLGVETPIANITILQKDLIRHANAKAKTVIVATQMLESMMDRLIPTRAEASDISNAILDGCDAVMLSGETAAGKYPVAAVSMMAKIIDATENSHYFLHAHKTLIIDNSNFSRRAICNAALIASDKLGSVPIVVFTEDGEDVWYLSKLRPAGSLYAFSHSVNIVRQLALSWDTRAVLVDDMNQTELIESIEKHIVDAGFAKVGESIILINGSSKDSWGANSLRVKKVGEA